MSVIISGRFRLLTTVYRRLPYSIMLLGRRCRAVCSNRFVKTADWPIPSFRIIRRLMIMERLRFMSGHQKKRWKRSRRSFSGNQTVLDHGLTTKEMEDGIEQLKGSLILGNESISSHMNRNARNELHLGMHPTLEDVLAEVEQITPADIQEMIAYIFSQPPAKAYILPEIEGGRP